MEREVGLKWNATIGDVCDVFEKGGVEGKREIGKSLQLGWVAGIVGGEHAGGGG